MRERRDFYVKRTVLQLAKREMHAFVANKAVWLAVLGVGIILGISGPFGTIDVVPLLGRLPYWITHAIASYLLVSIAVAWCEAWAAALGWSRWLGIGSGAVTGAALVLGEVLLVDLILFGAHRDLSEVLELGAGILVIVGTICAVIGYLRENEDITAPDDAALLTRLPPEKRGALISLSVSDHYVEVTTDKGAELLLMRLSDAIRETNPIKGMQIHRSHWAALEHMEHLERIDGKPHVRLSNARALPVSRTYLNAVREANAW